MLEVDFQQTEYLDVDNVDEALSRIEEIIQYAYEKQSISKVKNWEMSIIFTDNIGIQAINAEYRDKNQPTDVISFAFNDADDMIIQSDEIPQILGEIFISVEKARQQAIEYGHSFERELLFLSLHGFLHLLGYDHLDKQSEKEMFTLQDDILDELKIYR